MSFPDFLSQITWVDFLAWALLLRTSYLGWRVGLTQEIVRVIGVFLAAVVAVQWYGDMSARMAYYVNLPDVLLNLAAYGGLVAGTLILTGVARFAVEKVVKFKFATAWERPGGLVMGLLRGVVLVSLLLCGALLARMGYLEQVITERGFAGPALLRLAPAIHQAAANLAFEELPDNELSVLVQ